MGGNGENMEDCIFCKIINGEIPAAIIYEDGLFMAFLDINPRSKGHTLVIPKTHRETLFEMNEIELSLLGKVIQHISKHLVTSLGATGYNIFSNNGESAGQVVKHVHFHILPRYGDKGHSVELSFPVKEDERNNIQDTLRKVGKVPPIPLNNISAKNENKNKKQHDKNKNKKWDYEGRVFDEIDVLPDM